jgi:hypothetical protein
VPSGAARDPETQLTERQIHIIADHEQLVRRGVRLFENLRNCKAASVHVRQRHHESRSHARDPSYPTHEVAAPSRESDTAPVGQPGDNKEPNIVTGTHVFVPGIPKPGNNLHYL